MSDSLTDVQLQEMTPPGVPAPDLDHENAALIDARQAYVVTVVGAILFCAASLLIVMMTRMG